MEWLSTEVVIQQGTNGECHCDDCYSIPWTSQQDSSRQLMERSREGDRFGAGGELDIISNRKPECRSNSSRMSSHLAPSTLHKL